MLFIYRVLPVGGIETFFVRMAKERAKLGLSTSILLLSKPQDSNQQLLTEIKKYADVLFTENLFLNIPFFSRLFPLLVPIKMKALKALFDKVDQIHVFDGMHGLLGYRLSTALDKKLPITVGVYHYIKYLWGGMEVAMHEKVNREFIFDYLPEQSLLFFSEGNKQLYVKHKNISFDNANTFRLGVVDRKSVHVDGKLGSPVKIIGVGRLVEFKTYNCYMIDVIKKLIEKGINIQLDIYGDGPLKEYMEAKIKNTGVTNHINLLGTLEYSKFDETVAQYDLFVGSGTAIIQAAALGVPSIVGVENVVSPKTYGYFSNVHQYEYNMKGLNLPLIKIEKLITEFVEMPEKEREILKRQHVTCIDEFTNESCQQSMNKLNQVRMPSYTFKFNRFTYVISYALDMINRKFNKKHPRVTQFEDFRKLNEN